MTKAERDAAVRKSEEGATDLKKTVEDLSKILEDSEREYQVILSVNKFQIISEYQLDLKRSKIYVS